MASKDSPAVLASIAAGVAVAITKFTAAILTGSSAMVSEGCKSLAGVGRGILLLVGGRLARRPADALRPFGRGKELFFWTLISALLMLVVGGGGSLYQGVHKLLDRKLVLDARIDFIVLAIAAVFTIAGWIPAIRTLRAQRRGHGLWHTLWHTRDTATITVFVDGCTSLLGLLFAYVGIHLAVTTGEPAYDAAAAILIGLIWIAAMIPLIQRCRRLLIGEAIDPELLADVERLAAADPDVSRVVRVRSLCCGVEALFLDIALQSRDGLSAEEVAAAARRIEAAVRARYTEIRIISLAVAP